MRNSLKRGTKLVSTYTYTIDSAIGAGANCIVYDAHFLDRRRNRKAVRIKECFPIGDGIFRKGENVCWADKKQKEAAFKRFVQSYQISNDIQNKDSMSKSGVYTLDTFELNNTMYMVMIPDHGISYDKDASDNVADAINTALALTNVIGEYHRNGYLHLDIKPSNFIAVDDSTGNGKNIILFDTDTVVSIDDIRNGIIPVVSYSKEWAAPEQMQQKMKKICPATDLFSIGAILFGKIMGRPVSNEDMGVMAVWEYDERLQGKNVNPAVRRVLTEIFHRTLSANVKRRYQSATELSEKLNLLIDLLTNSQPFIVTAVPPLTCTCVGRESEIDQIFSALKMSGKVFVKGFGGIGKSTLAREYAEVFNSYYDAVVYLRYDSTTTIYNLLETIQIENISQKESKYETLQAICDERTLIIIDNLDIAPDEGDLDLLLTLNCHMIVTSRTDFSDAYSRIPVVELSGLSYKFLKELFEIESGRKLSEEEYSQLYPLMHWGEECTLFWFMLARLVKSGGYSIAEINSMFISRPFVNENNEKILVNKDGTRKKLTIADAMCELFRLAKLDKLQIKTLNNIYFLQTIGISKQKIREIGNVDSSIIAHQFINAANDLIELGFVQEMGDDDNHLFLSDMLGETIVYNIHPLLEDADIVNALIDADFLIEWDFYEDNVSDELENDLVEYYYNCLVKIFMRADMDVNANAAYMVDKLFYPACKVPCICDILSGKPLEYILFTLLGIATDKKRPIRLRIRTYNVLCGFYGDLTRIGVFEEDISEDTFKALDSCEECFMRALKLSENIELSDDELDDLCYPIVNKFMSQSRRMGLLSAETIDTIIELDPPIINQNVTPWKQFKIAALKNLNYQKLYLQRIDQCAKYVSEEKRKSFYYKAIGRILISSNVNWTEIDAEHFQLLRKFYSTCADRFSDIDKINVSDFAEDPLGVPKRLLFDERLIWQFNFMMSFETWDEFQAAHKGVRGKMRVEELDLSDYCHIISCAEGLNDIYSSTNGCIYYVSNLSKDELYSQKEYLYKLISILIDIESRLALVNDEETFDDGEILLKTKQDVELQNYALQTILFVANEDYDSADDSFFNYIQSVDFYKIYDIDCYIGGNGSIIAPWLWLIISCTCKFVDSCIGLLYLLIYTKAAEAVIDKQEHIPGTMLYELYKEILRLAKEVKSMLIDSDDSYNVEMEEYYEEFNIDDFLESTVDEYAVKIQSLFPTKFDVKDM